MTKPMAYWIPFPVVVDEIWLRDTFVEYSNIFHDMYQMMIVSHGDYIINKNTDSVLITSNRFM